VAALKGAEKAGTGEAVAAGPFGIAQGVRSGSRWYNGLEGEAVGEQQASGRIEEKSRLLNGLIQQRRNVQGGRGGIGGPDAVVPAEESGPQGGQPNPLAPFPTREGGRKETEPGQGAGQQGEQGDAGAILEACAIVWVERGPGGVSGLGAQEGRGSFCQSVKQASGVAQRANRAGCQRFQQGVETGYRVVVLLEGRQPVATPEGTVGVGGFAPGVPEGTQPLGAGGGQPLLRDQRGLEVTADEFDQSGTFGQVVDEGDTGSLEFAATGA